MGIDPGTTTGIAMLDMRGRLVVTRSRRNFSKPEISKFVSEHGDPLIITTDVSDPPRIIEKSAATFSAKLMLPEKDLLRTEKSALLRKRKTMKIKNKHERDALAAALRAWKDVKPLAERIRRRVRAKGFDEEVTKHVEKAMILKTARNIDSAIKGAAKK